MCVYMEKAMEKKLIEWILKKHIAAVKGNTENEFAWVTHASRCSQHVATIILNIWFSQAILSTIGAVGKSGHRAYH